MTESTKYLLEGYSCPIGRYPSPVTPIVSNPNCNDDTDRYMAVYIENNDWQMGTELVHLNSKFIRLSASRKKSLRLDKFDCYIHRLFAVSKNEIRFYKPQDEIDFFRGLLCDENFSCDDPFFRISLSEEIAEQTGDPKILERELYSGGEYLKKNKPELIWLLNEEKLKLKQLHIDWKANSTQKPKSNSKKIIRNKLYPRMENLKGHKTQMERLI